MKKCSKCGETKSLTKFHKDRGAKDGRQRICILCRRMNSHDVIPYGCEKCAFLPECKANIKRRTFDPYCFVTSKYYELYKAEYNKRRGKMEYRVNDDLCLKRLG